MSHQYYNPAKTRLQRSELAVPGSSPKMFEKALNSNADYIFLDLEDAVSPNDKLSARENIIKTLNEINWRAKGKTISVRINSLDTHYMYRDVVDIMEQVGDKIDTILIPKVGTSSDVYMIDCLLTQIENNKKLEVKYFPALYKKEYYYNGKLHREDKPAIIIENTHPFGIYNLLAKQDTFCLFGKKYENKAEFDKAKEKLLMQDKIANF